MIQIYTNNLKLNVAIFYIINIPPKKSFLGIKKKTAKLLTFFILAFWYTCHLA